MAPSTPPPACAQDDVTSVLAVGHCILAGSVDGTLRRFDVRLGRQYVDALHHPISGLALTRDGLCVLAACLDSQLRLLDVEAGELLAAYTGHSHAATRMGCAVLAGDKAVVGCSEDGAWRHMRLLRLSAALLQTAATCVQGCCRAVAAYAGRVCFWELVDAELVSYIQAHASVVCGVAAHPTEACLLTCSVDGTVKVWR